MRPVKDNSITARDLNNARQAAVVILNKQDLLEVTLKENNLLAKVGSREFSHQNFFGHSERALKLGRDGMIALQTAIELSRE